MNYIQNFLLIITALTVVTSADTTITNSSIGFSAYLPANWTAVQVSDSQVKLYDTTYSFRSQIMIKKHLRSTVDFPVSLDWTRAHFIAYLLVTQYSYDPFGAVLYFDSSSNTTQNTQWAPEAFSEFYTIDTETGSWNEYIRFTESNSYGYELYAIGDTTDMKQNIGTYAAIIKMITINDLPVSVVANVRSPQYRHTVSTKSIQNTGIYTLTGKRCNGTSLNAAACYMRTRTPFMSITGK
jgi:hypothetical protein